MSKRESWITIKSNLKINYSRIVIHSFVHVVTVLSLILCLYFTTGYGKTTFTTNHLLIVKNLNVNIAIIHFFSLMIFSIFGYWFIRDFILRLLKVESIEEIELFTAQKRIIHVPKEENKSEYNFKQNLFKIEYKKRIKKFLALFVVLITLEPVFIWLSIAAADGFLKKNPYYLSAPPTTFVSLFFIIYIASDDVVLFTVIPAFREVNRIESVPKLIYITFLVSVSCLVVGFSIIKYGTVEEMYYIYPFSLIL